MRFPSIARFIRGKGSADDLTATPSAKTDATSTDPSYCAIADGVRQTSIALLRISTDQFVLLRNIGISVTTEAEPTPPVTVYIDKDNNIEKVHIGERRQDDSLVMSVSIPSRDFVRIIAERGGKLLEHKDQHPPLLVQVSVVRRGITSTLS